MRNLLAVSTILIGAGVAAAEPEPIPDGHSPAGWTFIPGDRILIEADGLSFSQVGLHPSRFIDFGLPRELVVRTVARMRGRPTGTGRNASCRGGPMDSTAFGPLVLNFRGGRFVGWVLHPGARPIIEADLGLSTGIPLAWAGYAGEDARIVGRSRRGVQFETGGIGGFALSGSRRARVTLLYAGATCFARIPRDVHGD